jgi:hypothetical protein
MLGNELLCYWIVVVGLGNVWNQLITQHPLHSKQHPTLVTTHSMTPSLHNHSISLQLVLYIAQSNNNNLTTQQYITYHFIQIQTTLASQNPNYKKGIPIVPEHSKQHL